MPELYSIYIHAIPAGEHTASHARPHTRLRQHLNPPHRQLSLLLSLTFGTASLLLAPTAFVILSPRALHPQGTTASPERQ